MPTKTQSGSGPKQRATRESVESRSNEKAATSQLDQHSQNLRAHLGTSLCLV